MCAVVESQKLFREAPNGQDWVRADRHNAAADISRNSGARLGADNFAKGKIAVAAAMLAAEP